MMIGKLIDVLIADWIDGKGGTDRKSELGEVRNVQNNRHPNRHK